MITFFQFLENVNSLVVIDLNNYKKQAIFKAKELLSFAKDRKEKLEQFKLDINLIKNILKEYPKLQELLKTLESNNLTNIRTIMNDVHNWARKEKDFFSFYSAIRHLNDYYDSKDIDPVLDSEYLELANKSTEETNKNMIVLKQKIESVIGNLEWNGSMVTIRPEMPNSDEDPVPSSDSASIVVGKEALFSYFSNGDKFEIDDILEDDDLFSSNEEKQDYYNLISTLQNPNRKEQVLTLYTARPIKDRDFYSKTNYLPSGVFLTNSFGHADGLAGDLAGSEDRRDIYKVKINSKYVVKTLDGPIKYYQVVKDRSPVESINLY